MEIHTSVFHTITLFRKGHFPGAFYAWIGSRFKHELMCEGQYIYQEGDILNNIYFVNHGLCGYSLPRYHSIYIKIEPSDMFGVIDIVYNEKKM
jgi:CRP-like cAMP-binding protein